MAVDDIHSLTCSDIFRPHFQFGVFMKPMETQISVYEYPVVYTGPRVAFKAHGTAELWMAHAAPGFYELDQELCAATCGEQ